jgi:hypothetical protein
MKPQLIPAECGDDGSLGRGVQQSGSDRHDEDAGCGHPAGSEQLVGAFVVQVERLGIPGSSELDQLVSFDLECRAKKNVTRLTVLEVEHRRTLLTWATVLRRDGVDRPAVARKGIIVESQSH